MKKEGYAEFLERKYPHPDQQILKDYLWSEELKRTHEEQLSRKQIKAIIMFGVAILVLIVILFWTNFADAQVMPTAPQAAPAGLYTSKAPSTATANSRKWFWRLAAIEGPLASADIGTSIVIFQKGGYEREIPMLTGKHPNPGLFAIELYAGEAAWHYAAYRLEPKHPKLARVMQIGAIVDSAYSIGNNARVLANWKH